MEVSVLILIEHDPVMQDYVWTDSITTVTAVKCNFHTWSLPYMV